MEKKRIIRKSIVIDASPASVWNALIDPEYIKLYFYGSHAISDWRVGSTLLFTGTWEGKTYEDKGVILDLIPEKLLQYTYWSPLTGVADIPANHAVITYELEHAEKGTLLKVSQANSPTDAMHEHSETGWLDVLNKIKEVLEKTPVGQ